MKSRLNVSSIQLMLPPYDTFPELSSDDILLRQILPEDINNIVEISFYNAKAAASPEGALEMLNKINNDYNDGRTVHWGIVDNQTNIIVGNCGYYRGFKNHTGELGCVLKSEIRAPDSKDLLSILIPSIDKLEVTGRNKKSSFDIL